MMTDIIVVTSCKDLHGGIAILDAASGASISPPYKGCIAEKNCVTIIGNTSSSFSGQGSSGDFIVASQSQKPLIHSWHWNKHQSHDNYHTQEILTSLSYTPSGLYLVGGSKKGFLYIWDVSTGELVRSVQAHYKSITQMIFDTPMVNYVITSSEDGMVRVWELDIIVNMNMISSMSTKKNESVVPYRSWSIHTLPVKGICMLGSISVQRVASCSLDRTVVINDIHANTQVLKISLPYALESICTNYMQDIIFVGTTSGPICCLDVSVNAIAISAANALIVRGNETFSTVKTPEKNYTILEGHSNAVTSLGCTADDSSLISGSMDGFVRIWNIWTKQCIQSVKPFTSGIPITNALVIRKPEILTTVCHRPSLFPLKHLQKYKDDNKLTISAKILGSGYVGSCESERASRADRKRTLNTNIEAVWMNSDGMPTKLKSQELSRKGYLTDPGETFVSFDSNKDKDVKISDEMDDGNMSFSTMKSVSANTGPSKSSKKKARLELQKEQNDKNKMTHQLSRPDSSADINDQYNIEKDNHQVDGLYLDQINDTAPEVIRLDDIPEYDDANDFEDVGDIMNVVEGLKKKKKNKKKNNPLGSPKPKN